MPWSDRFLNGSNPPDLNEPKEVCSCSECGRGIYEGDKIVRIDDSESDEKLCSQCAIAAVSSSIANGEETHVYVETAKKQDDFGEHADVAYEQHVEDLRAQAYADEL